MNKPKWIIENNKVRILYKHKHHYSLGWSFSEITDPSNRDHFTKTLYNLSQEEIDQICKEMKAEQNSQLDLNYEPLPNSPITPNWFDKKKECDHDWKEYIGLNQKDTYCTKCPAKK